MSAASLAQLRRCEDHFGCPEDDERGLLAYTRTCFESFMEIFGSRAMRRMLSDDERAHFMGYFDAIPEEMPEALESDRQKLCWINVHYRPANPTPLPWIWNTGDEDFCAQVDPDELDSIYPTRIHMEKAMMAFIPVVMSTPEFLYHVEIGDEHGALTAHNYQSAIISFLENAAGQNAAHVGRFWGTARPSSIFGTSRPIVC